MGPDVARVSAAIYSSSVSRRQGSKGRGKITYYDAAIVEAAYDCRACAVGFREWNASCVEGGVAVMVGEVETRHVV